MGQTLKPDRYIWIGIKDDRVVEMNWESLIEENNNVNKLKKKVKKYLLEAIKVVDGDKKHERKGKER